MKTSKVVREEQEIVKESVNSQKGTLISVGFVASIIVLMWLGVFWLYMERI